VLLLTPALAFVAISLLWRVAVADPGFLPQAATLPPVASKGIDPPPSFLKVCNTCKIFRPVRAHHCRVCNRCVERHDHHCPWINNCVGRGNHRAFLLFLLVNELLCTEVIVECLVAMLQSQAEPVPYGLETALIVYAGVMFWGVGVLLSYQLYLVTTNQTTNEHIRHLYPSTPFHTGMYRNCKSFWTRAAAPDALETAREVTNTQEIRT